LGSIRRMLGNARVKKEILRLKKERLNREFFSESDIFQKYMDIAFADITDYLKFGTEEVPVMAMYGPVKISAVVSADILLLVVPLPYTQ
jgi:phage terminase small subunit